MAIPAYSSKGTAGTLTGDVCSSLYDVTGTCPGTVNAGDVLVFVFWASCFAGTVDTATAPFGFTLINSSGLGTNRAFVAFYKVADGTEDSTTITATGGFAASGISGNGQVYLFTGSGTGGVVPASGTTNTGTSTSATMSNVTTTATNSLAVCLVGSGGTIADATGESGGNWTKAAATDNIGVTNVAVQTAGMASIGSITGGTAAISPSTLWNTISFEIKEAVAAGIPNKVIGSNFAVKRANFF